MIANGQRNDMKQTEIMNTARYTIRYRNGMPMRKEVTAKKHVSPGYIIVITKIGLRLTFQPLKVFLNLERAIIATRTLTVVEEDTLIKD